MNAARRDEILALYTAHAKRFATVASRRSHAAGLSHEAQTEARPPRTLRPRPSGDRGYLSSRERDVLCLVAEGCSNQEIGSKLCITVETVKTHVSHVLERLGARNRAHAVRLASLQNLLDTDAHDAGETTALNTLTGTAAPVDDHGSLSVPKT
jgi:DNA-binding NarL/FixJ family response regulator